VATDNNLRTAKLEWIDYKRLVVCCDGVVRINTLVNALDSETARKIVWVNNIVAADLGNRHGFRKYREAGGRVNLEETLLLTNEKLEQQIAHNTRLAKEAQDAHNEVKTLQEQLAAKISELEAENAALKARLASESEAAAGQKRARVDSSDLLVKMHEMMQGSLAELQRSLSELQKENGNQREHIGRLEGALHDKQEGLNDLKDKLADARVLLVEKAAAVDAKETEVRTAVAARDLMQQKFTLVTKDRNKIYKRAVKTTQSLRAATTLHLRVRDARTDDEFEDVQREVGEYLQTLNRGNYLAMPARLRTTQEMLDDALGPDESTETCDVSDECGFSGSGTRGLLHCPK
jgi:chromosome segregation ATPase